MSFGFGSGEDGGADFSGGFGTDESATDGGFGTEDSAISGDTGFGGGFGDDSSSSKDGGGFGADDSAASSTTGSSGSGDTGFGGDFGDDAPKKSESGKEKERESTSFGGGFGDDDGKSGGASGSIGFGADLSDSTLGVSGSFATGADDRDSKEDTGGGLGLAFGDTDSPSSSSSSLSSSLSSSKKDDSLSSESAARNASATAALVSSALRHQTMEEIVNRWSADLEQHVKTFTRQAVAIGKWDLEVMQNGSRIHELYKEARQLEVAQKEIDQNLQIVGGKQSELDQMLKQLETDVRKLWQDHQRTVQPADEERESCYQLAQNVDAQLGTMHDTLKELIDKINEAQRPSHARNPGEHDDDAAALTAAYDDEDELDDPVSDIISILNGHLEALLEIDHDSNILQAKIHDSQQQLNHHLQH
jgi:nuclear pore complex protein Nup62